MLYSADAELVGYGMFNEDESELPIPFAERDFERLTRETEGLRLRSYTRTDREKRVDVEAELEFADLQALNAVYAGRRDHIRLTEADGRMQYSQVILDSTVDDIGDETRAFAEEFFADYDLVFEVHAPARIVEHNLGELSGDARRVRYSSSLADYATSEDPMTWRVEWER